MTQETCKELRVKIAQLLKPNLKDNFDYGYVYKIADQILVLLPQPEVMSEEEIIKVFKEYRVYREDFNQTWHDIAHALAGKIKKAEQEEIDPIMEQSDANLPEKIELPEELDWEVLGYKRIDYDELQLLRTINQIINYLKSKNE